MHIVFDPFWQTLKAKGITQYRLIRYHKVSAGQLDRIRKNEYVSTYTIEQFCRILDCGINDIIALKDDDGNLMPFSMTQTPAPENPADAEAAAAAAPQKES